MAQRPGLAPRQSLSHSLLLSKDVLTWRIENREDEDNSEQTPQVRLRSFIEQEAKTSGK
jgi:hypothetical protein